MRKLTLFILHAVFRGLHPLLTLRSSPRGAFVPSALRPLPFCPQGGALLTLRKPRQMVFSTVLHL
ncbi:hypothetical protein BO996_14890 [Delftia sp. HK171]|nr:hypothetical protein BO996_14890 [Delftia sp. HK171]